MSACRWTVKQCGQGAASPPDCWNNFRATHWRVCFNNPQLDFPLYMGKPQLLHQPVKYVREFHPVSHICLTFSYLKRAPSVFAFSVFTLKYLLLQSGSNRGKMRTIFMILVCIKCFVLYKDLFNPTSEIWSFFESVLLVRCLNCNLDAFCSLAIVLEEQSAEQQACLENGLFAKSECIKDKLCPAFRFYLGKFIFLHYNRNDSAKPGLNFVVIINTSSFITAVDYPGFWKHSCVSIYKS